MPKVLDPMSPGDHIDYFIKWTDWLQGDTIVTSSWSVDDPDMTIESTEVDGDYSYVWVTGGNMGQDYALENVIETAAGRTSRASIIVPVRDT